MGIVGGTIQAATIINTFDPKKVISETIIPLSKAERALLYNHVTDIQYAQSTPRTIFCIAVCKDGHEVYGVSACRDLAHFDEGLGKAYALRYALGRMFRRLNDLVD